MNHDAVAETAAKLILSVDAVKKSRNVKRCYGWELSLWWPEPSSTLFVARTRAPDGRTWLCGVHLESKSKSMWMKDKVWRVSAETAQAWGKFVVRLASRPIDNTSST